MTDHLDAQRIDPQQLAASLDEKDHADRYDRDGDRWEWCEECDGFRGLDGHGMHKSGYGWTAAELDEGYGPVTFVPQPASTSPQATSDDLTASGAEGEEMFKCRTCEQEKPAQGFYGERDSYRNPMCKQCRRDRGRPVGRPYRVPHQHQAGDLSIAARSQVASLIKTQARCTDCGGMGVEFDHLPEFTKEFDICWGARMPGRVTLRDFLLELAKCEVVCSDCHVKRTVSRRRDGIQVPRRQRASADKGES